MSKGRKKKWVYQNLLNWANENKKTIKEMVKDVGITLSYMSSILLGKMNPTKRIIDAILAMTGLPYEVAFATEPATPGDGGKEISA